MACVPLTGAERPDIDVVYKDLGPVWFMGNENWEWEFNSFPMFGKSGHGKWMPCTWESLGK
ncbi:hypothetical protein Pyn_09027 [Prunus yedoensis var. nudiflora]|uniref:Uncharacterized protein n=1 Tax=Prunus yedoensis var. nudiflora TaxID=2094558 RepID=A0A314YKC5_PRUYE|nr:hypothetical protein Pyn_09027 [Prunus yedoensis var. nudiflora]